MSHDISTQQADNGRAAHMPGWARALDERGKRLWRAPSRATRQRSRRAGYVVAVVVNAILIVVAREIPTWGLSFVTPSFGDVLPAIERSLVATMIANAIFFSYDIAWFRHLAQAVLNAFALSATLALRRVFPFDFGTPARDDLARLALLFVIILLLIAIVVEIAQTVASAFRPADE